MQAPTLKFGAVYSIHGPHKEVSAAATSIQKKLNAAKEPYKLYTTADVPKHNFQDVRFYVGAKDIKRAETQEFLVNIPSTLVRAVSAKSFISRVLWFIPMLLVTNFFGAFSYFLQDRVPAFKPSELKAAKSFDVKTGKLTKA
jgi:hypothetical protein